MGYVIDSNAVIDYLGGLIIAATAIVLNYSLVTRNTDDFKKINSLKLLDPWLI